MKMCHKARTLLLNSSPVSCAPDVTKLGVSNHGDFVILEVDGSRVLEVGLKSKDMEDVISADFRLALGGLLIDNERMLVQFESHMDGCVREGSWLNLSTPWETEVDELWPCYQNIQPGIYFPGTGFAVFNTSVFPIEEPHGLKIELWGDFGQMDGTILSVRAPGQELMFTLTANNNTKEVTLALRDGQISMKETSERLSITIQTDSLQVIQDGNELKATRKPISPVSPGYSTTWRESSHMAIGGLLGAGDDNVGSKFLTGCLKKIQVQGKDLALDLAVKRTSVSTHSCPV